MTPDQKAQRFVDYLNRNDPQVSNMDVGSNSDKPSLDVQYHRTAEDDFGEGSLALMPESITKGLPLRHTSVNDDWMGITLEVTDRAFFDALRQKLNR